ncbi:MAG TPA: hypothetical protein PKA63_11540, partial [Oligoflexia bacterium]|nr:hypothetical protein [Oligoflexia bacterium]
MSTIHYVDALCGAGKTSAALNWAYEAARKGEKICFVQPTRALIDESYSILSKMDPDNTIEIEKIYYDKTEHVSPRLDRYLRDVTSRGTILFITQSAYLNLRYFHNSQQWHLCMDELLVPFEDISVNISNTASIFLKGLKSYRYNELLNSIHFEKGERHPLKLKKNKGDKDEVQEVLRDLTKYLNNKHYKVLVVASNWLQYNQRSNRHKFQAVAVFDLQVLTTFKTTIVMGAMLADSLLSALVQLENSRDSDLHVCLKEFAPISKRMYNNVREHKIKGLVTIKYAYDRNWTKTFAHAATKNLIANTDIVQSNFIQAFITRVDQEFKDRQFIYSCNKSEEEQLLNTFHMGAKVSGTPHGLNKFKDYQCAAYLTSNNPSPTFFYTLKLLGIDSEKVRKQLYLQNIYQFVMRISLRDPYSTENVTLIVPDYCAACFLNKIFPNSVV